MFIFDTFIYIAFACVMCFLAKQAFRYNLARNIIYEYIFVLLYIVFFVFISAFRYNVGVDSLVYISFFKDGMPEHTLEARTGEFIWVSLVDFVHRNGIHYTIAMGFMAWLEIFFLVKSTKKCRYILIAIPIVLFSGRFYIEMMNGMRQMIVACFFVYASKWIVEKKFFRYCLFVWIAHYFHNSALMLLPIYFIPQKLVLADKQKYTLFIFLLCFLLGQTASFQSFSSFIGDYANLVGYNDYVNVVNDILNDSNKSETMAMGITMISYFLMSFFVILFSDKLRIRFRDDIKCFDIWYNYSYIYSCGFFLFCNVSHIFIRPLLYFELFLMYMLSLIIIYCWEGLNNVRLLKFCSNKSFYVFFVSILWVGLVWTLFKNSNLPDESLSYKMIFNHTI